MRNVALDLGVRKTTFCEVSEGAVVQRATVVDVESLRPLLGPGQPPARIAIEACREAWHVHDRLVEWDNEVLVIDTTRSKEVGIGSHGRKNDRIDAETMARAVERGGIPVAHVLSPHRRQLRRWLGVRRSLVEARANLVTTLRGLAREQGLRLPSCPSENFAKNFRNGKHPTELAALLEAGVKTLEVITAELDGVERKLVELCADEPVIQLLTTAPGVGLTVASAFVSVIDDARRFRSAHEVASYLGLVPSEDTTGGRRRLGAINKHGDPYLRALLVQAAWSLWRTADASDPLRLWTAAVAERRGRRIAVIALARRIAGVLWALWRHGTVYDPTHLACSQAGGVRRADQTLECQAQALERAARKRPFNRRTRSSLPEVTPA